jgi:hypothetical protein
MAPVPVVAGGNRDAALLHSSQADALSKKSLLTGLLATVLLMVCWGTIATGIYPQTWWAPFR